MQPASAPTDRASSFTLELLGDGQIPVRDGQTILDASLAAGIPHYHECGGHAECSTCRILVHAGDDRLSPMTEAEAELRRKFRIPEHIRLACQTYVRADGARAHRMIRDDRDLQTYIGNDALHDTSHTGQQRELALFFLDLRNFTPFVESYLPFDVIHVMRRLFTLFRHVVEAGEGRIIETAGDGFYACFGFGQALPLAIRQAVIAAHRICEELAEFNRTYMFRHFRHRFEAGIGIHCGAVISGNIGIGVNNNITVMGLPVNIAARLQAATREANNNILISEDAYRLLEEKPRAELRFLQLKGITAPLPVRLLGKAFEAGH